MATIKFSPVRCALALALATVGFSAPTLASAAAASQTRVIVNFKAGSSATVLAAIAKLGGRVVVDLSEVNAVAVTLPSSKLSALKGSRGVESVENDSMQKLMGGRSASGTFQPRAVAGQTVPYGITQVQADQLPTSGATWVPKVCIVDSGIDATHEDLSGNTLTGKNYTTSGSWNTDENGHGTHVAGTVAGLDNAFGVIGVAGNLEVTLHISKVFDAAGSSPSSVIAKGMLGCLIGKANIVSMSLGGSSPSPLQQKVSTLLTNKGMLLIAAAGNAGTSAISYPAGFAEVMSVAANDSLKAWANFSQFNADVEISGPGVNVLSSVPMGTGVEGQAVVGGVPYQAIPMTGTPALVATAPLYNFGLGTAVDAGAAGKVCLIQRGNIAFSDKVLNCQNSGGVGALIYNNAPGPLFGTLNGVPTTIPSAGVSDTDGAAMLGQIGQSATVDTLNLIATNYSYLSGTSMSTPHVSAVAARVWSLHQTCTAQQIRASLTNSAQDLGDPGRDDKFGAGLVQAKDAHDRIVSMGCGN